MIYDYYCHQCCRRFERQVPVDGRDSVYCCNKRSERIFQPAEIMLPERFKVNLRSLVPTYDECKAIDARNDAYLNEKREPEKASFEECLEKACVENRVDPRQLANYQLKNTEIGKVF